MRLLRAADRTAAAWRNGAGETAEVAAAPGWRISIAALDRDAPFSRFDGYDRTLLLIEGGPIALALSGRELVLATGDCLAFPGEEPVAVKVDGPARALNVMTVRRAFTHQLRLATGPMLLGADEIAVALDGGSDGLERLDAVVGPGRIAGGGCLAAIRVLPQKR